MAQKSCVRGFVLAMGFLAITIMHEQVSSDFFTDQDVRAQVSSGFFIDRDVRVPCRQGILYSRDKANKLMMQ